MANVQHLKQRVCQAIDRNFDTLSDLVPSQGSL